MSLIVTESYQFVFGRIPPTYLLPDKLLLILQSLVQMPSPRNLLWALLAHPDLVNAPSPEVLQGAGTQLHTAPYILGLLVCLLLNS